MNTQVQKLIQQAGGKLFRIQFRKADGTIRTLVGRTGVVSPTKSGVERKLEDGVVVREIHKGQFRTVKYDAVVFFKCGSSTYGKEV